MTTRLQELQGALRTKTAETRGMSNEWKYEEGTGNEPGGFAITTEEHAKYLKSLGEAKQIKALIDGELALAGIDAYLDAPEGTPVGSDDAADMQRMASVRGKSLSDLVLGTKDFEDMVAEAKSAGSLSRGGRVSLDGGIYGMEAKDVYSALGGSIPSIPSIGSAQSLGWTQRTLRPGRVRDLFPAERTSAAILYGVRQTGYTNAARHVRQRYAADGTSAPTGAASDVFGLKPKSTMTLTPVTYPISTIAHIMYIHSTTMADEPRLRGLLDRDMVDGVKMAEDAALLYGDGVGESITGLMNTPGIQSYTGLASDKKSAQVRRAATRAILAFFEPTGVILNPLDWEDLELETDLNGAYRIAVSVALGGEKRLWRLNVVDTPAINETDFLVGAFGTGAKLYDREQVNVVLSTENKDGFERNFVTLRAEERVALVVDRPESFVNGSFTEPV